MTHPLTPAEIAALRLSAKTLPGHSMGENFSAAAMVWEKELKTFVLLRHGKPIMASRDPLILAQVILCAAAEPNYALRILDPRVDPETASKGLDPYTQSILQSEIRAEQAKARMLSEADAAYRKRRADMFDVTQVDLDFLD